MFKILLILLIIRILFHKIFPLINKIIYHKNLNYRNSKLYKNKIKDLSHNTQDHKVHKADLIQKQI